MHELEQEKRKCVFYKQKVRCLEETLRMQEMTLGVDGLAMKLLTTAVSVADVTKFGINMPKLPEIRNIHKGFLDETRRLVEAGKYSMEECLEKTIHRLYLDHYSSLIQHGSNTTTTKDFTEDVYGHPRAYWSTLFITDMTMCMEEVTKQLHTPATDNPVLAAQAALRAVLGPNITFDARRLQDCDEVDVLAEYWKIAGAEDDKNELAAPMPDDQPTDRRRRKRRGGELEESGGAKRVVVNYEAM